MASARDCQVPALLLFLPEGARSQAIAHTRRVTTLDSALVLEMQPRPRASAMALSTWV